MMVNKLMENCPKNASGTYVSNKDIKENNVTYTWWEPEVQYAWSVGPAMSRFLQELKKGRIIGRTCTKCNRILVPPRMFCEYCYTPTQEWIYLKDTGTVETFSISYLDSNAKRIEQPILIGVISIDGASPHHGFMHYFGEIDPKKLRIGMKVQAVWKNEKDRKGSITDIEYFKPLSTEVKTK